MMASTVAFGQLRKLMISQLVSKAGVPSTRGLLLRGVCCSSSLRQKNHQSGGDTGRSFEEQERSNFSLDSQSSQEESQEQEYEHSVKQRILKASMPFVCELGWTKKALEAGAQSEGLPPVAQGMFPRGGAELIHYFYGQCNSELGVILAQRVEQAKQEGLEKPKTKPFIRDAVETRLRMIAPYMDQWPQAMAIQTLPQNAAESWTNLLNLVDEIWFHAGDRSVDFNWYTKRLALAGVYKTSEVFMLQDKSEDQQETWAFMDRRLEDLQTFGASKKSLEQTSEVLKESLLGFCIMGRNMLGMNSRDR
ncbi:ubiquinone biosynthesis protein COQ9, mitochondrial isoform X2 [Aplysia californica]|uniref:Ubiquinone biosynthesis protein n=1 Tax=Aplysia californica TaxID=6500 RepID=A0ABM0JBG0_APLCA|nr:ubiquinone biosynthesis protein COQ9, mitochondrial isoform X2 [Aplysia californica]